MNRSLAVLVFAIALVLGYFQERIKVGTNFILTESAGIEAYDQLSAQERRQQIEAIKSSRARSYDYYFSHPSTGFLFGMDRPSLGKFKWLSALVFVALQLMAVLLMVWLLFAEGKWLLYIATGYFLVLLLAFSAYALGSRLGFPAQSYAFARELLGALQSPAPLMLILPAIWLSRKLNA